LLPDGRILCQAAHGPVGSSGQSSTRNTCSPGQNLLGGHVGVRLLPNYL